jgi:hypothetical protein
LTHHPAATRWQFELLGVGRHVRIDPRTKIVVGRNVEENAVLERFADRSDAEPCALMIPAGFAGPHVVVVGRVTPQALELAGALMLRCAKSPRPQQARVRSAQLDSADMMSIRRLEAADALSPL